MAHSQPLTNLDMAEFDLLNATPEQMADFLSQGQPRQQPTSAAELPPSVAPDTQAALAAANDLFRVTVPGTYVSPEMEKAGQRPGVFLDTERGAEQSMRVQLGFDRDRLNQMKQLIQRYGPDAVDIAPSGRFVLRNQPEPGGSGRVEDVLVDPVGMDKGDWSEMTADIIPAVAGAAGARFGFNSKVASTGLRKVLAATLGMAVSQEVAGGVQDFLVRLSRGDKMAVPEIAKRRALLAAEDAALGLAMAGGAKVGTKVLEGLFGLGGVGVGGTTTTRAREQLREATGVNMGLTPGEAAESTLLLRGENIARSRTGVAAAIDAMDADKLAATDELRRAFLGYPRTMTDDELEALLPRRDLTGQRALRSIREGEVARLEGNLEAARTTVQQAGTQEAQQLTGVNLKQLRNPTEAGKMLRQRVVGELDAFRGGMGQRYDNFLSLPQVQARAVDGSKLAERVNAVAADFTPTLEKAGKVEALDAFVAPKFRAFVDQLKEFDGGLTSINSLKQIRTSIDNSIAEGVAIPGVDVAQLRALRQAVGDTIEEGLAGIDPKLLSEWKQLSSDYKAGMSRFENSAVRRALVPEGEPGSVGNTALAESILGGGPDAKDTYDAYKAFLGPASNEFKTLQEVGRQQLLHGTLDKLTGYIGGQELRSRLSTGRLRPEIASELLGTSEQELHRIGEILAQTAGNLDSQELIKLARGNGLTAQAVKGLVDAEAERAVAYNNKLIRAAATGEIDAERIKPSDFVRHASRMDPDDVQKVVGALSQHPALLDDIKQLAVEDLWSKLVINVQGQKRPSAIKLSEALGSETQQRTWEHLVGKDTVANMKLLVETLKGGDLGLSFKGGIAGAMDVARLGFDPQMSEIKKLATRFLIGVAYSGPLRRSVTNMMTSQDRSRFLNGVIASEPFVEAMLDRFGPDSASGSASLVLDVMNAFREMVEPDQMAAFEQQARERLLELTPEGMRQLLGQPAP